MPKKTHILLAEDDMVIVNRLVPRLEAEGYLATSTSDGNSTIEFIKTKKPDLVTLDLMLPELDGLSICRMVKKNPELAQIQIIILTARAGEMDKIIGLEGGADDYITKPFSTGELISRIRAVLRRSPNLQAPIDQLKSDDLIVNISARKVFLADKEVFLSNKEFNLLAELMRNKGLVLTRDLLLTKVWGYDYFVDKRTVDVHIRWLREKIEVNVSSPKRIVTVRAVGYRFEG